MSVDFNFDNLTKTFHCLLKTLLLEEYPCKKVYQNNVSKKLILKAAFFFKLLMFNTVFLDNY